MYLAKEKGYDVYAACANTGGFSAEQLKTNEENAYKLGAVKYVTLDVTQEYYEKSLKYMVYGNVLRNGTYPISVSSERIFQALAIARYANEIGADAIAHGSTGAGNDQIRFDMTFLVLAPGVEIITLTRDNNLSRQEEIDYLNANGFSADFTKLKYSYNVGLWGTPDYQSACRGRRGVGKCVSAHHAPLVCDASAGEWGRFARDSGYAGSRQPGHNADLHSCGG